MKYKQIFFVCITMFYYSFANKNNDVVVRALDKTNQFEIQALHNFLAITDKIKSYDKANLDRMLEKTSYFCSLAWNKEKLVAVLLYYQPACQENGYFIDELVIADDANKLDIVLQLLQTLDQHTDMKTLEVNVVSTDSIAQVWTKKLNFEIKETFLISSKPSMKFDEYSDSMKEVKVEPLSFDDSVAVKQFCNLFDTPELCALFGYQSQNVATYVLRSNTQALFIPDDKGAMCAGITYRINEAQNIEIQYLTVRSDCRNQGLASALIYQMQKVAGEKNISTIQINVLSTNQKAFQLYKKLGFVLDYELHRMIKYLT